MGKKRIKSNNVETDYYKKYQRKKKLKEPINEYTITMDVKFLDDISKSKLFVLILFFFFHAHIMYIGIREGGNDVKKYKIQKNY